MSTNPLPGNVTIDATELTALQPHTVIEDVNGTIWEKRQRMYGSSWYQPGDSQPHGQRDIALPATVLRGGQPWSDDSDDY
jgi:hypothetical protein